MPLFYLHLYDGQGTSMDEEGVDYPDLTAARDGAVRGLRGTMAHDVLDGVINLGVYIEVEDDWHHHLATVRFSDVVKVTRRNDHTPRNVVQLPRSGR